MLLRVETKEDRHLTREIMEFLAFAMYPITLTALCDVLMIELSSKSLNTDRQLLNPKDILNICGSFLNYESTTDIVSLAHQSVRTFLTSSLQGEATFFQLSHDDSHRSIALKCLTYLSLDEFESERIYGSVDDRLDCFPFLHYAAHFWPLHVLRLNRVEQDRELWETMKSFLLSTEVRRNNFRAWVQVLAPGSNFIRDTRPLYYAASFGLTDIVRYLLDMGSDAEARGGHGGATPINIASLRGNAEVVQLLLDHGADPYAVDIGMGKNSFFWAKRKRHIEVMEILNRWRTQSGRRAKGNTRRDALNDSSSDDCAQSKKANVENRGPSRSRKLRVINA